LRSAVTSDSRPRLTSVLTSVMNSVVTTVMNSVVTTLVMPSTLVQSTQSSKSLDSLTHLNILSSPLSVSLIPPSTPRL